MCALYGQQEQRKILPMKLFAAISLVMLMLCTVSFAQETPSRDSVVMTPTFDRVVLPDVNIPPIPFERLWAMPSPPSRLSLRRPPPYEWNRSVISLQGMKLPDTDSYIISITSPLKTDFIDPKAKFEAIDYVERWRRSWWPVLWLEQ